MGDNTHMSVVVSTSFFINIDTLKICILKYLKMYIDIENTYSQKMHNRLLKICTTNFLKNVYKNN